MWRWIAIYHLMPTSPALSEYVTTTLKRCVISAHSWTGRPQTLLHAQLFAKDWITATPFSPNRTYIVSSEVRMHFRALYVPHHTAYLKLAYESHFTGFSSGSRSSTRQRRSHFRYRLMDNQFTFLISSSTTHHLELCITVERIYVSSHGRFARGTQFAARAFRVAASLTQNDLLVHIRSATFTSSFRKQLKPHMFGIAYN